MLFLRIDRLSNFPSDGIPKSTVQNKTASSFESIMQKSQSKLQLDALNQLIGRIDIQGSRLVKERSLENLREYKMLVKQFVQESINFGLQLSEKHSFDSHGGMKTNQLIEVVDEKLLELTDQVLSSESDGLETLRIVGEIKGLLINVYM